MYTYPSAECVKSFDCDNKAYNFLALLTQLKRVIDRARARAGQGEGSHHREVRGIFTYATSKGKKGSDEAAAHNANNRKTRTNQTGWQRNLLAVSFRRAKKEKRNTCTHVCTYTIHVHGVYEAPYICHGIFICAALNMHYATQRRWGLTAVQYCVAIDFRESCQGSRILCHVLRIV